MKNKYYDHFHIAGFTYHEGVLAFEHLQVGTQLLLKPEPENRHDEDAVAIWHGEHKLGFVPRTTNKPIATILNAGHDIFEVRIQQLKPHAHPENQVQVVVWVKCIEAEQLKNRGDL